MVRILFGHHGRYEAARAGTDGSRDKKDHASNVSADLANTQTIRYIHLGKTTRRELAIEGSATYQHIVKDGSYLEEVPAPAAVEADTSTDLRVELALQRLGLAADMGGVLSLSKHEDLRIALRSAKLEVPPFEHERSSHATRKEFWNQLSLRAEGKVGLPQVG